MAGTKILHRLAQRGAGILLALGLTGAGIAQAVTVKVTPDTATLVNLAGKPATLIVGNPAFADVAAIGNKVLVQGRNYGKTNVIVLDAEGRRLAQFDVVVSAETSGQMIVYRGSSRRTYVCKPACAAQLDTTDDPAHIKKLAKSISKRQEIIATIIAGAGGSASPTGQ